MRPQTESELAATRAIAKAIIKKSKGFTYGGNQNDD